MWIGPPSIGQLTYRRWYLNSVLLPDSTIGVFGGESSYTASHCSDTPALVPELWVAQTWFPLRTQGRIRDYHSTALLLPSGKVLSGGGESRGYQASGGNCPTKGPPVSGDADFELFNPPHLACGSPRSVIRTQAAAGGALPWTRGIQYDLEYDWLPLGVTLTKAVLMRAGSVTHHCDVNQRCVELEFSHNTSPPPGEGYPSIKVTVPTQASGLLPRGYYMLFLVTNQGVPQGTPSTAVWVQVL